MTKFVINDLVTYIPEQHRLLPNGKKGNETILNIPASRCLQLLLSNPGKVISQQDFFAFAWQSQGRYVTNNTFYQNVSLLRRGLVSAGIKEEVIKTVPKKGLLFCGTVQVLDVETTTSETVETATTETAAPINFEQENDIEKRVDKNEVPNPTRHNKGLLKKSRALLFRINGRFIIINPMLLLLIAFLLIYLASNYRREQVFVSSHIRIANMDQCTVYVNKNEMNLTNEGYIQFLKTKNIVCRPNQFIYITDEATASKSSEVAQRCDKLDNDKVKCETLYPIDTARQIPPAK
ncbi:winged helix-turn-helix domain-containing protein [Serratia sp. DD3]|uniref:winged helix-turn-helix domain-containing protein n=1 Tax=Serratia sp. DD3 TaxID=1410619 RepID=UPI0004D7F7E5|nr:winged helix-turn-helix domain-containing protein [Serratia sp. DD3]KEY58910.1 hypothetical protein SRDD_21060 [Serratia sp. DD3]